MFAALVLPGNQVPDKGSLLEAETTSSANKSGKLMLKSTETVRL